MRVRRSLLNFATLLIYTAVTTLVALRATPLLQNWLGGKRFGASRVVLDAYGYLTLLELGLGGALAPLMSRAVGRGDDDGLHDTVAAGVRGYLRVSAVTVAVGALLTPVVPFFARGLSPTEAADFRTAWVVGLGSFLALALIPMRSLVEVRQLGYVVNLLLTAQSLVTTGLSLWLASLGWGITGQSAALVAGTWVFNLALTAGACRTHPGLLTAAVTRRPAAETRRALRGLSLPTLLINISGRVSNLTDNLVVGSILGPDRVTSLFNTQRLAVLGQTLLSGIASASWAALAELHARGDLETFNRRLIELSRLVAVLAVAGLAPVIAYNHAFVRLWLGPDGPDFVYAGDLVVVVASINVFLIAQQSLWAWCFAATGHVGRIVSVTVSAAVLNLSVSVSLTHILGVLGPLLGTTAAMTLIGMTALPVLLRRVFETPTGPLLRAVGGPLAWGVLLSSALYSVTRWHQPDRWVLLAAEMSAAAVASLAFSAVFLLTPEDRDLWKRRLRAMRPARTTAVAAEP
ncbi:MAG: hypothetical protein U0835_09915 [Isosphaeraceae bacterium]